MGADLARQCPLLTPQQLYRLTEHYDNDWAVGAFSFRLDCCAKFPLADFHNDNSMCSLFLSGVRMQAGAL